MIGGLADEKVRWAESVSLFDAQLTSIVGDVLVSAGSVAYLGPFTVRFYLLVMFPFSYSTVQSYEHLQFVCLFVCLFADLGLYLDCLLSY